MADATFDGDNLLIDLPVGQTTIQVERELYSAWKDWVKTGDNAKYQLAMRTVAGDPTSATEEVAATFFVRNDLGWRIRAADEDIEISFVGNLYAEDADTALFEKRATRTVLVQFDRSVNARVISDSVENTGIR